MSLKKPVESDTGLIKLFLATGDTHYWGLIYQKYKREVFAKCFLIIKSQEDAQDLAVETFIRAFENLKNFDVKRPLLPWLNQIASNLCIDLIRKKNRIQFEQIHENSSITPIEEIEQELKISDLREKIMKAIQQLQIPQRRCCCLFYIQQRSYQDITALTGYPLNEVRSHIQNGRRKLRLLVEKWSYKD
jgi:RNA polymerase sigma factor (sigma-70 family)